MCSYQTNDSSESSLFQVPPATAVYACCTGLPDRYGGGPRHLSTRERKVPCA